MASTNRCEGYIVFGADPVGDSVSVSVGVGVSFHFRALSSDSFDDFLPNFHRFIAGKGVTLLSTSQLHFEISKI